MLRQLCAWDRKFTEENKKLSQQLLLVVAKPRTVVCPRRQAVCELLLDTPTCCIREKYSDVAIKVRMLFGCDLRFSAATGRCTKGFHLFVLLYRHLLPHNNQYAEGLNNTLQTVATRARNCKRPTANAKMSGKVNEPLDTQTRCDVHSSVAGFKRNIADRFVYVVDDTRHLADGVGKVDCKTVGRVGECEHASTTAALMSSGFTIQLSRNVDLGAAHAFALTKTADGFNSGVHDAFKMGQLVLQDGPSLQM